jgi:hypothetical protein
VAFAASPYQTASARAALTLSSPWRAQELACGLLILPINQDFVGSRRRQAVAGPSATVGQFRQAFDTGTAQPGAEQLSFRLGPDNLNDDKLIHAPPRYPK